MNSATLIKNLQKNPKNIKFNDVMSAIESDYDFTPTAFNNGGAFNEAGQNSGSCKVFAFAQRHNLDQQQTLACFGQYYREDVLKNPDGDDHQNIRNFMKSGWGGITFDGEPLRSK